MRAKQRATANSANYSILRNAPSFLGAHGIAVEFECALLFWKKNNSCSQSLFLYICTLFLYTCDKQRSQDTPKRFLTYNSYTHNNEACVGGGGGGVWSYEARDASAEYSPVTVYLPFWRLPRGLTIMVCFEVIEQLVSVPSRLPLGNALGPSVIRWENFPYISIKIQLIFSEQSLLLRPPSRKHPSEIPPSVKCT